MTEPARERAVVPAALAGERLDRACAALFPDLSRGAARRAIAAGAVFVDGARVRACSRTLPAGAVLQVSAPADGAAPDNAPLEVLYEDAACVVVAKPAGKLTQGTAAGDHGSVVADLEERYRHGRARGYVGLVHRLDRAASGLLVLGRTEPATAALSRALQAGLVHREYLAVVRGVPEADAGLIDLPLWHDHRTNHVRVDPDRGRPARTRWQRLGPAAVDPTATTLLGVTLETGRTHQIRVHLAHALFPIVGDRRYGGPTEADVPRLFLHAVRLSFPHPTHGATCAFMAPPPATFGDAPR